MYISSKNFELYYVIGKSNSFLNLFIMIDFLDIFGLFYGLNGMSFRGNRSLSVFCTVNS